MTPRPLIERWIETLNAGDADALSTFYADDAVLHIVHAEPVRGRENIQALFRGYFAAAKMHCIPERLVEAGDTVLLEWRDPIGLLGCNVFEIEGGVIVRQRNYFDQLTFFRKQGIPIPA